MVATIPSKTILQTVSYNGDFWFGIDYNVNLYRAAVLGVFIVTVEVSVIEMMILIRLKLKRRLFSF